MVPGAAGLGAGENEKYCKDGRYKARHGDHQRKDGFPAGQVSQFAPDTALCNGMFSSEVDPE